MSLYYLFTSHELFITTDRKNSDTMNVLFFCNVVIRPLSIYIDHLFNTSFKQFRRRKNRTPFTFLLHKLLFFPLP